MVVAKDDEEGGIGEQKRKYEEIIAVLLEAGYFRARISTLSEFDKCVGGLCWAIVNSGVEVDVDILFTENATIGQRIALSEAIVTAMRKMKCPHNLQPHQIQGGIGGADYIVILPVIVWLIKKFYAVREERDLQMRSFSTLQFGRDYTFPFEADVNEVTPELGKVLGRNKVSRKYRRPRKPEESEETRVHSCLLEYGYNDVFLSSRGKDGSPGKNVNAVDGSLSSSEGLVAIGPSGGMGGMSGVSPTELGNVLGAGQADGAHLSGFEKKLMQEALKAEKEEAEYLEMQSKEANELMESMQSLDGMTGQIGGSLASSLLGLTGGDISQASAGYRAEVEAGAAAMEKNLQDGKLGTQAAYKRQRQNLMNEKAEMEIAATSRDVDTGVVLEKLKHCEEEVQDARGYNAQLKAQIEKLNAMEKNSAQRHDLKVLQDLIVLNESLKAQEAAFKQSCKSQMVEYKARIASLTEANKHDSDENRKLKDIEDMHAKVTLKYDKLRQLLAEMNLEVSANVRVIDDIPTRTELIQYERRFGELYQQVAWKLKETRKYYDMYNTLTTTLGYMHKNVKVVDGIYQGFHESMKTSDSRASYSQQVKSIDSSVTQTLSNEESRLASKRKQCEDLKAQYRDLVDEQRAYYAAIKDFQAECEKNDWLTAKLEAAKAT